MAKKGNRIIILLECITCKSRNYVTSKNKMNTPEKIDAISKFCKNCRKHTDHKEVQKLK